MLLTFEVSASGVANISLGSEHSSSSKAGGYPSGKQVSKEISTGKKLY